MRSQLEFDAEMVASAIHCNQIYGDNLDYVFHLRQVVDVVRKFAGEEPLLLAAAWLHDSIEDQNLKYSFIKEYLNEEVAKIVFAVTNEGGTNRRERHEKTYPKIRENIDARIIKLADRIANISHSIATKNISKYNMYKKEMGIFKYFLHDDLVLSNIEVEMWRELDKLMTYL